MSDQYLPWSPSEQRYGAFIPEGFKVCQGTCEWLNSHHDYMDGNEYRPARLYTPDEITALERDAARYQRLRERAWEEGGDRPIIISPGPFGDYEHLCGNSADAEIDREMKGGER